MTTLCCPPNLLCAFIIVFLFVYYLESIGGTYTISVIQSLEKHFQIPSKMSGTLISASDLGYVPTVVVLAYLGSRGNRAKWIGGGCILVAAANFIMASPNFIFARKPFLFNETAVDVLTKAPEHLLRDDVTPEELLDLPFIKKKMPPYVRDMLLDKVHGKSTGGPLDDLFGSFFDYEYEYEDKVHGPDSHNQIDNATEMSTTETPATKKVRRKKRNDSIMEKNEMQWNPDMVSPHIIGVKKPPKVKALEKFAG